MTHECPHDPFGEMFHAMIPDEDMGELYDSGCWTECAPSVEFHWDQWMVCVIYCLHGAFKYTACGINFTESFQGAVAKFNDFDHSQPTIAQGEGEDWAEYFRRVSRTMAR